MIYLIPLLLLLTGCGTPRTGLTNKRPDYDSTPRIAIMSAFEPELEKLRQETKVTAVRVVNGRSHYVGRLEGHEVVLVLSGISMVNATMTAQALVDRFNVREIIFTGIAGGVNPGLRIGDVTVPAQWGQYQDQVFARQTAGGWDTGIWPANFPNYGMMFPLKVQVATPGGQPDNEEKRFWFPVDPASLKIVAGLTNRLILEDRTKDGASLEMRPRVVVGGRGVSGPTFVDNAAYREWVWQTFQADAVDMETAAVAMVAYVNRVPFIAFRSLSDLAGGGPDQNEMATFFKLAAANSATVVLNYLRVLDEGVLAVAR
jgi:adenosylhomocysteine nucleosidase